MNLGYLALVAAGMVLSVLGFVLLGKGRPSPALSGLVFLSGVVSLVTGILLACVPDFFRG